MAITFEKITKHRDRIFNRTINELCKIKGLEFITNEEYKELELILKNRIEEELITLVGDYIDKGPW